MVVKNSVGGPYKGKYFTAYASRKRHIRYRHDHQAVLAAHKDKIVHHHEIEDVFSRAMGNYAYQMRSKNLEELKDAVRFIHAGRGLIKLHVSYHKKDSFHLGRPMEYKRYGHSGRPVIVFPTSGGRFFQYED